MKVKVGDILVSNSDKALEVKVIHVGSSANSAIRVEMTKAYSTYVKGHTYNIYNTEINRNDTYGYTLVKRKVSSHYPPWW